MKHCSEEMDSLVSIKVKGLHSSWIYHILQEQMGVLKIIWKSVGRQADLRYSQEGPMREQREPSSVLSPRGSLGKVWAGAGDRVLKELRF